MLEFAKRVGSATLKRFFDRAAQTQNLENSLSRSVSQGFLCGTAAPDWHGKTLIDVTILYGVPPEEPGLLTCSTVIVKAFVGSKLIKAFNHLPASILDQDTAVAGGRRVVFLAGDDDGATGAVATLVEQLGYAPIKLRALAEGGTFAEGGRLVQARDSSSGIADFPGFIQRGEPSYVRSRHLA